MITIIAMAVPKIYRKIEKNIETNFFRIDNYMDKVYWETSEEKRQKIDNIVNYWIETFKGNGLKIHRESITMYDIDIKQEFNNIYNSVKSD